jgi:hypothetical protein
MIIVEASIRGLHGGYVARKYSFKNQKHMENWKNKWFVRLGVDQFNIISDNTKKETK